MPIFKHEDVRPFGYAVLQGAGANAEEARLIVDHHVEAILTGEDDHGWPLGTQYIPDIKEGTIKLGAAMTIEKETPTTLMVNGNFNTGHYVSHHTMTKLIAKAKSQNVAAASIKYQCHVGRMIDYTKMAADEGLIALMMCDGAWGPKMMAPWGGADRRLGINPWSMALPNDAGGGWVGFDMTCSASSGSKVTRAREQNDPVPEGWVYDKNGNDTTNAMDFFTGGTFAPMGGRVAGHKGYALCFVIEVLADILSGMEYKEDKNRPWPIIDGCFMALFNVEAFRPLIDFKRDLHAYIDWLKTSRPADGSPGVFYPGERSHIGRQRRLKEGIDIPQYVWERVLAYAKEYNVSENLVPKALGAGANDDRKASNLGSPKDMIKASAATTT